MGILYWWDGFFILRRSLWVLNYRENVMLNCVQGNNNFQIWLPIRWQHSRLPFRSHVRKSYLTIKDINKHYNDVIMGAMATQITSLPIVYSTVYSRRRSKKHQSSASLAFVRGIHRWPVNSPHKGPVTRKMFPFDDVIMRCELVIQASGH